MQGLADGYFILPYTLAHYLATNKFDDVDTDRGEFKEAVDKSTERLTTLLNIKGKRTVDDFHRELGLLLWDKCGMARNRSGLEEAMQRIPELREEYWKNVLVSGVHESLNQSLERANRVADYFEFAELMVFDALHREESCGGHFREEYQTEEGEALRDDENCAYVAAWEFKGVGNTPNLHKEPLDFEHAHPSTRSYK